MTLPEGLEGSAPPATIDLDAGLIKLGYREFRPGQREAIETLMSAGRLLLVAPTGGGKSLTYQLPATLLSGTTLVVSPLVSLMHDQVLALEARGVRATYLAGTLESTELRRRMSMLARGDHRIVYVTPERLSNDGFRATLETLACPLVAVDEAHCISQWGHDFRPEYLQIAKVLPRLSQARVLACTATATPVVRDEILEKLGLPPETPQRVHGFARPNLALRVRELEQRHERRGLVDGTLQECLGAPGRSRGTGIVYAPTRRITEDEAERLRERGWRVEGYHAGMTGAVRTRVQSAFAAGELELVVATNAFGMGIDRPDVRCVIHLAPPDSIEAYYQEAGRAGRDGNDAVCLLMVSPGDMPLRRRLIESPVEGRTPDPEIVSHKWNMFLELMRWAEGGACRHDAVLRYFDDEAETLDGCRRCDNCLRLAVDEADPEEVSVIVRKALCGVARVDGRFGIKAAAKLLKGSEDERLARSGLDQTRTYGVLSTYSEDWLVKLLRRCVTAGWVDFTAGDRPVVVVTREGHDVIRARRPARLLLPPTVVARSDASSRRMASASSRSSTTGGPSGTDKGGAISTDELDEAGRVIFEALRVYRLETARENVPPYVVASDRTLRDLALLRPATLDQLRLAHGIGPMKLEKYGAALLAVVKEAT